MAGEMSYPHGVRWVGGCEIKQESESLEVLANIFNRRISCVEPAFGVELRLHGWLEARRDGRRHAHLRALRCRGLGRTPGNAR